MRQAERLIAWRYLKPTKGEGFISVIAAFALVGIALGVGTLIVVLAVMNGFRSELLGRVLGVNGHATIIAGPEGLVDDAALVTRIREIDGVVDAMAYVEGQVMASANDVAAGAVVRGVRAEDLARRDIFADNIVAGTLYRPRRRRWRADRHPHGAAHGARARQPAQPDLAQGCCHRLRHRAADQELHRRRPLRGRHVRIRQRASSISAARTPSATSSSTTG